MAKFLLRVVPPHAFMEGGIGWQETSSPRGGGSLGGGYVGRWKAGSGRCDYVATTLLLHACCTEHGAACAPPRNAARYETPLANVLPPLKGAFSGNSTAPSR
eukprot:TRINITY_DN25137_c0_g1_i1.p2 TRINITY_DN25137_c0_g1~~TRINITY_DN25137_c0_g1_i1.p2  ORF type:complete len:102 (-),score=4.87 TRINITY_DN25137_c0_g1_i1:8-313(-)